MGNLPKACVILGAGASHDVRGEGSPILDERFKPPLARDLFDIAKHGAYWDILQLYPGAQVLTQRLATVLQRGQVSVEQELTRYSQHKDPQIRAHFVEVPAYIRDLVYHSCNTYTHVPSSYVELIQELMVEYPHEVLFIVLNYDTFLESALSLFYPGLEFRTSSQYIRGHRQAKIVKLHGSVNWFARLSADSNENWRRAVSQFDVLQVVRGEIVIKDGISQVCADRIENYWAYPVLTAPIGSKGIGDAVCPESHIQAAREFIASCNKYLIIGSSGLDKDLLTLIDSEVASNTACLVHIVDVSEGADASKREFMRGVKAFGTPQLTQAFKIGFRGYLRSQHLQDFAKSDSYRE